MSYTNEQFETYILIMQCLQSEAYAGKEFQDKAYRFLELCSEESMSGEECKAGWEKLHEEYEQLSKAHWQGVLERIGNRPVKQRELFV